MPLSPAPLLPGLSPLPEPGRRPPDRRALRLAALAMLPALILALLAGPVLLPGLGFFVARVQGQAGGGVPSAAGAQFQGFVMNPAPGASNGGYTSTASLTNMREQASVFHMNAVIIPVIADMPVRSGSGIYWHAGQSGDYDTLPVSVYVRAIEDARKAGLVPVLELQVRQFDSLSGCLNAQPGPGCNSTSTTIGRAWYDDNSQDNFVALGGNVGTLEKGWFDNYTSFAASYAALSQKYHLPYFIFGDQLDDVTTDTTRTSLAGDKYGVDRGVPGESFPNCTGRRDCEWRHVVHALRSPEYANFLHHATQTGGGYSGKLIYASSWGPASDGLNTPEFEQISWWGAVDIIGVDAYFPLTQMSADLDVASLERAWNGALQTGANDQKNIAQRLAVVAAKYNRPILFTAAGYASSPGANNTPSGLAGVGSATGVKTPVDGVEQFNDMQALLQTFNGLPWWEGVFWNGEQPISPHYDQANWASNSNWAGDSLATSKPAGQWLATFYHDNPLPCGC